MAKKTITKSKPRSRSKKKRTFRQRFLNFEGIEFKTNWASGTTIVILLVGIIMFYLDDQSIKESIKSTNSAIPRIDTNVNALSIAVAQLKGSQDATGTAINQFMQFPPTQLDYRLKKLEEAFEKAHGTAILKDDTTKSPFKNAVPK